MLDQLDLQVRAASPRPRLATVATSSELRWALVRLLPMLAVLVVASILMNPGRPTGDEGPILAAAHRLLQGRYAVPGAMDATQFLWHGPGLPALLAPLVALGVPLTGLRLTSPLLMFVAVLLFYRLLRLRLGRRGALIGAYALGLYGPAYYVLGTVAKDPLALALSIAALDGTARYLKYGRRRQAVIAGLSLGALVMTRLEYGWVITLALLGALLWWLVVGLRDGAPERARTARRCVLICGVAMLACLPWLTYTFSLTHRLFYWGNSGGLSLYWMSATGPSPLGEWHAPHTVVSDSALAAYRPFFHYLGTLRPVQRDLELQHVAIANALAHPASYAVNLLANLGRMFVGLPFPFTLPISVIAGLIVINGGLLVALICAVAILRRARSSLPRETIPFLLFAAVAFAVHLLPTSEPRLVVPIIPIPMWLVAQAFARHRQARASPTVLWRRSSPQVVRE